VSSAGTVTRGDSRPGEVGPGRRLLLLSESAGLAAVLTRLLDRRDRITRTGWSREAADQAGTAEADLVVLDVPAAGRAAACHQLRRRYHGPVVVLVERGDDGGGLPADQARTLLARPFSTDELRAALGLPRPAGSRPAAAIRPAPPAAVPAPKAAVPGAADAPATLAGKAATLVAPRAGTGEVVSMFASASPADGRAGRRPAVVQDGKAAAQQAPPRPGAQPDGTPPEAPRRGRLALLLAEVVHGWRARRAVRVAGFAGVAAVAFLGAFALAAQGRCGPGCDILTGIITPASTLPAAGPSGAAPTTVRRLPPSTTTPTPGGGARGVPGAVLGSTTSTTARRATTTTRRPTVTTRRTTTTTGSTTTTESTTTTDTTTTTAPPTP
jgi:hypothetical protein